MLRKHEVEVGAQLQQWFGLKAFRPGQREAIEHALAGRDVLVVMPTGSGKSLIYQYCALALPGTTLVISPLIALMKDQVDRLQARGIPATYINSALTAEEQARRVQSLRAGAYRLVYVAPERLRSPLFAEAVRRAHVSLLAVDEAHCISQWGHDFRPDYLRLGEFRRQLGMPTTLALTATATPEVQEDIARQLGLVRPARVITGFQRPNLVFHVRLTPDPDSKLAALRKVITAVGGAGIVYVGTRREAEELTATLQAKFRLPVYCYHGGMERSQRAQVQDAYLHDPQAIMVATNAFGMGVDRPDVRFVVHYTLPGSLEAYYQEAGRAGRDGKLAQCVLLYDPRDRGLQEWFIENDMPTAHELQALHAALAQRAAQTEGQVTLSAEELSALSRLPETKLRVGLAHLERVGAVEMHSAAARDLAFVVKPLTEAMLSDVMSSIHLWRAHKRAQLDKMVAYAETTTRCRQQMLVEHFGDRSPITARPCCDFHIRQARGEAHPDHSHARAQPKAASHVHTLDDTAALLAQGLSISEVAARRGLVVSTIYTHAAKLIAEGRLSLRAVVSEQVELAVRRAIAEVGSAERLAPIKALLPEEVEYGAIRCVVAQVQREQSVKANH